MTRSPLQSPPFALVIGTFASTAYIHLQLEARRRLYPEVPLLVHDDASPAAEILQALCGAYGAGFIRTPLRLPPCKGDLSAFARGLDWARGLGADVLVKLSRRFIPLTDWRPSLAALAGRMERGLSARSSGCRLAGGISRRKWWDPARMQAVVDQFAGRILFVQTGEAGHHHPPLWGVFRKTVLARHRQFQSLAAIALRFYRRKYSFALPWQMLRIMGAMSASSSGSSPDSMSLPRRLHSTRRKYSWRG